MLKFHIKRKGPGRGGPEVDGATVNIRSVIFPHNDDPCGFVLNSEVVCTKGNSW